MNFLCSAARGGPCVVFFVAARKKNLGLVDLFVFVMRHMHHCHLNAASDNGERREMDEMRRRNRNQSHSRLRMMEEVTACTGPGGKRFEHMRVTRRHDGKLVHMKNWPRLMMLLYFYSFQINIPVFRNSVEVTAQKNTRMDLYSL